MARAWKFFPVVQKVPALPGDWRAHSTSDEAVLEGWLDRGWGLALDCGASGVTVIDPDADKVTREPVGDRELAALGALPDTYEVHTPGGGRHLYFDDPEGVRGRDLADHVNVRSIGGYVVFDDGREGYRLVKDMPLAPLPAWVRERVAEIAATRAKAEAEIELDLPANIRRATQMLDSLAPAVEGAGGDSWTLQVINKVLDIAPLSPDAMLDVLCEWNERCDPPWEDDELRTKIENALAYRQNDLGAWAVAPPAERFGAVLDRLGVTDQAGGAAPRKHPFYPYDEDEQDTFEPPKMILADFLPAETLVMLYGQPGSYKSFLALDAGLRMASAMPFWDQQEGQRHEVVYVAGEGPRSIARLRRPSWREYYKIAAPIPFHLVKTMPHCAEIDQIDAFIEEIKARHLHPSVVVIDTLARFMLGMDENAVKEAQVAVHALERIRDKLGCAVLAVHHEGKGQGSDPRGSSALIGGFDTLHRVVAHKTQRAVAVTNIQQKDGEERVKPWLFHGKSAGRSLVFEPIDEAGYKKLTAAQGGVSVGAILTVLQKIGRAISTQVLASELYQGPQDEEPAVTVAQISEMRAKLDEAARRDPALAPYTTGKGHERVWRAPQ